jgi:hypothetical protein
LQCKAGGTYSNDTDDVQQHLRGDTFEFEYLLQARDDEIELDRQYTWIKCNRNFKSFYSARYSDEIVEALATVLTYGNNVSIPNDSLNPTETTFVAS